MLNTPGSPYFEEMLNSRVREAFRERLDLDERIVTPETLRELMPDLQHADVLIGTWGFPVGLVEELASLPELKLLLFAGGSVKAFAGPFLERGIPVIGGREANALPAAEFCLAQIILSNKGYFQNIRMCRTPALAHQDVAHCGPGNYGETVALLGYGRIARRLRHLLQPLDLNVIVVDPTVSQEEAERERVSLASMEEAFSQALVVSNHLPNFPHLHGAIGRCHFERMRPYATFVNTGRGQQVNEKGLAEVLAQRSDLVALLDVTYPEPPLPDSPLYTLPNVHISSHISGAVGMERRRLTNLIIEELDRFLRGEVLLYSTRLEELDLMA